MLSALFSRFGNLRGLEASGSESRRRLITTFGAQIYNQVVTVGIQLALIPVLLYYWGAEQYGVWVLLSAIPSYLTFADLGFTLSAKNALTISVARGDRKSALEIYQSTFVLITLIALFAIAAIIACLVVFDPSSALRIGNASDQSAKITIAALSASVLVYQYLMLLAGGLRAIGRPAGEVAWTATGRLLEGVSTIIGAMIWTDFVGAALAILASRLLVCLAVWYQLRVSSPWLRVGLSMASFSRVRELAGPSLAFLAQTLAQLLMIQGPVIVLGALTDPIRVAVFSACRTLVRVGTTGTNFLNATFLPEYTALYSSNRQRLPTLIKWHATLSALAVLAYVASLFLLGRLLLNYWTKGAIQPDEPWFSLLILATAAEMVWTTGFVALAAINRHVASSYAFGILSIIAVAGISVTAQRFSLNAVAIALLATHVAMIGVLGVDVKHQAKREASL
ncbi:lipopolysaccharide biosynthesis protein [Bradyrhizobium sp. Ec3.3]|uniref:lipopolysaccharide biosynthesis protein n=1 Tax=Bradyrhizobium sp. Ec3.3 TaxID=189753 RepID=UPI0004106D0E|nr:hypothetical protein [Bradyrhizobium sp. Ec3.3]